jgi:hypothetical protein
MKKVTYKISRLFETSLTGYLYNNLVHPFSHLPQEGKAKQTDSPRGYHLYTFIYEL